MLQSAFRGATIGVDGSQSGNGSVTPHASATSSRSVAQFVSQLGTPSPSRSPRMGGVKGSVQSGDEPACSIAAQVGSAHVGRLLRIWKNDPVPLPDQGAQLTPTLQPGGSSERLLTVVRCIPRTR